ncbi:hypothetical protein MUK42_02842 [Musa troglodytarum]|uniref:Uncharacterized protein n=1 Tax=Musa troglodytarum TaxID=320322 RepID=A0A9E7FY66_9LILI|nr:hypothetical protein MUK42_02842 [Musa troglodytarum]
MKAASTGVDRRFWRSLLRDLQQCGVGESYSTVYSAEESCSSKIGGYLEICSFVRGCGFKCHGARRAEEEAIRGPHVFKCYGFKCIKQFRMLLDEAEKNCSLWGRSSRTPLLEKGRKRKTHVPLVSLNDPLEDDRFAEAFLVMEWHVKDCL